MTRERLLKMKEDAEIMLIRMEHNPSIKLVYKDINFRYLIEDINICLRESTNTTNDKEGFFEPTPEELEEIAFMSS